MEAEDRAAKLAYNPVRHLVRLTLTSRCQRSTLSRSKHLRKQTVWTESLISHRTIVSTCLQLTRGTEKSQKPSSELQRYLASIQGFPNPACETWLWSSCMGFRGISVNRVLRRCARVECRTSGWSYWRLVDSLINICHCYPPEHGYSPVRPLQNILYAENLLVCKIWSARACSCSM